MPTEPRRGFCTPRLDSPSTSRSSPAVSVYETVFVCGAEMMPGQSMKVNTLMLSYFPRAA